MKLLMAMVILTISNCKYDISNSYDTDSSGLTTTKYNEAIPPSEIEQYFKAYDKTLTLWPVPYRELIIETGFGNAHVISSGSDNAPPMVLLHGMNASSTMWYPNIGELSKDHKVYAIDNLTEPGKSEMTRQMNNVDDLIKWYVEIVDKLGIEDFTLIGASKGGWLAVKLALSLQNRVKKLILLSPLQTFSPIPPGTKVLSAISYGLNPNPQRLRNALNSMSTHVSEIDKLYIDQFHLGSLIADPANLLVGFIPFSRKELRKLKMPVLVLIGDQDIINNKAVIEIANEFIPHAETWIIPDAGHFLSMDQTEITNFRILDFLN